LIRTVLIDDEIDSNRILQTLLENYCPQVSVVGTADGVGMAVDVIRDARPDLVFMDIEMTEGNAFDLLIRLQPVSFHVIFVTAFDNYAVRAFRYSAVDYLLKPVNIIELCTAIEKLPGKAIEENVLEQVRSLLENMQGSETSDKKLAFRTSNGLTFLVIRDIIRLEARGHYTLVHLQNGTKIRITGPIKDYADILPEPIFFRIHNSHIINLNKIKFYQRGRGGYVTMDDNSRIEVANRRREAFIQRLLI